MLLIKYQIVPKENLTQNNQLKLISMQASLLKSKIKIYKKKLYINKNAILDLRPQTILKYLSFLFLILITIITILAMLLVIPTPR